MKNSDTYMLTQSGRDQGELLAALYKADRYLSINELMRLSQKDKKIVMRFLKIWEEEGSIERMADDMKWGIVPEVRQMIKGMLLRNGWSL
jgi:DNA-binding IclR family transcriptional regulator